MPAVPALGGLAVRVARRMLSPARRHTPCFDSEHWHARIPTFKKLLDRPGEILRGPYVERPAPLLPCPSCTRGVSERARNGHPTLRTQGERTGGTQARRRTAWAQSARAHCSRGRRAGSRACAATGARPVTWRLRSRPHDWRTIRTPTGGRAGPHSRQSAPTIRGTRRQDYSNRGPVMLAVDLIASSSSATNRAGSWGGAARGAPHVGDGLHVGGLGVCEAGALHARHDPYLEVAVLRRGCKGQGACVAVHHAVSSTLACDARKARGPPGERASSGLN